MAAESRRHRLLWQRSAGITTKHIFLGETNREDRRQTSVIISLYSSSIVSQRRTARSVNSL